MPRSIASPARPEPMRPMETRIATELAELDRLTYVTATERRLKIEETATDVGLPQKLSFSIWIGNGRKAPRCGVRYRLHPTTCTNPLRGRVAWGDVA